ncbi:MAG: response regulator [Desulfobacter sp.]|nr:MAG: response regulator [Desulfobacter sp.]
MYRLFSRNSKEDGIDFKINPLTLLFLDPGLETAFKADYFRANLSLGRACHLIAVFFYGLVGLWDGLVFDPAHLGAWLWVLAAVCLVFTTGFFSSFYIPGFYARYWQPLFAFYVIVTGGGFAVISVASGPEYPAHNFVGIIFCLFFCYAFIRLTFLWATAAGTLIVFGYSAAVFLFFQVPAKVILNEFFYMFGINLLGMMVCYALELFSRRDYMLNNLLKRAEGKAREMNALLERRVAERTKEFTDANRKLQKSLKSREKLEAQLLQAQKMESVGRLAGGVAHDYNNISSVIIGYSELSMETMDKDHPLYGNLEKILSAAKRATDITRQLLAFARKQTVSPKVIDLNNSIERMLKILGRLIGENIRLEWTPGRDLWPVKMDPSQIDQILANLCVNARDAIPDTGRITIETKAVRLDRAYCDAHEGAIPGEYSMIAVADNGKGMAPETLDKIFEPFFTTKAVGRGTGLGLATVYGIVKQNNGYLDVDSEPENGTRLRIYLSCYKGEVADAGSGRTEGMPAGQGELILMVEDDPDILDLGTVMLKELGYRVLSAGRPETALKRAAENEDEIHLLLSDVIMPELDGRRLAKKLQAARPGLKVLFMSGYTADIIAHRGVLDDGVNFIAKPFSKAQLAAKVRKVLDGKGADLVLNMNGETEKRS